VSALMKVVDNSTASPPYPPDVRARGMVFHVDIERMKQSTSWILCPQAMRPWMLMTWVECWSSAPCGTFANDDEIIAARIGMDQDLFRAHRKHLMRGWYLASDSLLYHPFITTLVESMRDSRKTDREKKARQRAEAAAAALRSVPKCPPGLPRESPDVPVRPPTGTGTGTGTEGKTNTAPRKRSASTSSTVSVSQLVEEGVDQQVATDWLHVRSKKKLPLTSTAWSGIKKAALDAGKPIGEVVETCAINGWAGFKVDWLARPDTIAPSRKSWEVQGLTTPAAETNEAYLARVARENAASRANVSKPPPSVGALVARLKGGPVADKEGA